MLLVQINSSMSQRFRFHFRLVVLFVERDLISLWPGPNFIFKDINNQELFLTCERLLSTSYIWKHPAWRGKGSILWYIIYLRVLSRRPFMIKSTFDDRRDLNKNLFTQLLLLYVHLFGPILDRMLSRLLFCNAESTIFQELAMEYKFWRNQLSLG